MPPMTPVPMAWRLLAPAPVEMASGSTPNMKAIITECSFPNELQRIADISYIFGQSIFAGMTFTAADMSGRLDGVNAQPTYSGALVLAGRTPLGPMTLSLAATTTSEWQLVLGLGRPIEERTINDPIW